MASHLHSALGKILRYWDSELISRAKLFRERTGAEIGGEIAHKDEARRIAVNIAKLPIDRPTF